jgi:hypothetical protein
MVPEVVARRLDPETIDRRAEAGEPVRVSGYELPDDLVPLYGPTADLIVSAEDEVTPVDEVES